MHACTETLPKPTRRPGGPLQLLGSIIAVVLLLYSLTPGSYSGR